MILHILILYLMFARFCYRKNKGVQLRDVGALWLWNNVSRCENEMSRFAPFSTVSYFTWEKKSKTGQEMVYSKCYIF